MTNVIPSYVIGAQSTNLFQQTVLGGISQRHGCPGITLRPLFPSRGDQLANADDLSRGSHLSGFVNQSSTVDDVVSPRNPGIINMPNGASYRITANGNEGHLPINCILTGKK
jgi:hypothetical protein